VRPFSTEAIALLVGALALLPLQFQAAHAADAPALQLQDDEQRPLELARPAQRIVSLSPGATAMLFAAGAGDRYCLEYRLAASDRLGDIAIVPIGRCAGRRGRRLRSVRPDQRRRTIGIDAMDARRRRRGARSGPERSARPRFRRSSGRP